MTDELERGRELDAFLDEVERGAAPWTVNTSARGGLRQALEGDFAREIERGAWPAARPKLMRIAKYVGALAAFATEIGDPRATVGAVRDDFLAIAAEVVKTLLCPSTGGADPLLVPWGRFCTQAAFAPGMDAALRQLLIEDAPTALKKVTMA